MPPPPAPRIAQVRRLGLADYLETWQAMRAFTDARRPETPDELWCLEHPPVFTLGQAGKPEHLLMPGDIPVIQTDRGGQVTYHGPGQLVLYPLLDLQRLGLGPRALVSALERAMIATLAVYGIEALAEPKAPGVYVKGAKIGSIGLRVRRGTCYHGLSLNVAMDLAPFARINPCGYRGLAMTQVSAHGGPGDLRQVAGDLLKQLAQELKLELSAPADRPSADSRSAG